MSTEQQMNTLIAQFPAQLKEAVQIGEQQSLVANKQAFNNVLLCGLGGSGIGASMVKGLVKAEARIPVESCKSYFIPNYINDKSLVIISSYSGNTEETLNLYRQAASRGARIVCISSGGEVIAQAQKNGHDYVLIPDGMPPRACLGYSFVQQLYILQFHRIIGPAFKDELKRAIALLEFESEDIQDHAKSLAQMLSTKTIVIYSADDKEAVSVRWRQQINENAKMLCWHHAIPEMNHNELVGWRDKNPNISVIFLRSQHDFERIQQRIEINKEVIGQYAGEITEIFAKGESKMEEAMYLTHIGDWLSYYLAECRRMDAVEVNVITSMKDKLAKLSW